MLQNIATMRDVDIRTVDKTSLVDLKDVHVNENLLGHERLLDYVRQIGNPYCYIYKGIIIKEKFSNNGRTLEDCLGQYIGTLI